MNNNSALAKKDDPVSSALAVFNPSQFNLLVPITHIDQLPEMHRLSIRQVVVNPDTETYPIPGGEAGKEKVALSKVALDKIAMAAGIQWIPNQCGRVDDTNDPYFITYRVAGLIRNFDGQSVIIGPKEKTVDLRGEPGWPEERLGSDTREFLRQATKKTPSKWEVPRGASSSTCRDCGNQAFWIKTDKGKNVLVDPDGFCHFDTCPAKTEKGPAGWDRVFQARQHILSLAESKAKARCIREAMAIPIQLTKEQAAKPFVVASLVLAPDMNDPDVKRAAIAHMFGASAALYGPPSGGLRPAPEPIDVPFESVTPPEGADLKEGEWLNGHGEIHEPEQGKTITAAEFVDMVDGPESSSASPQVEPWDLPLEETRASAPPPPRRFMLTRDELAALDAGPRAWFTRFNELCQAAYDKFGQDIAAEKLCKVFPLEWPGNAAFVPAEDAKAIGKTLLALVGR